MTFNEFKEVLADMIDARLEELGEKAIVAIKDVEKINEWYTGLIVKYEDIAATPTFNLDGMYEDLERGETNLEGIADYIIKNRRVELPIDLDLRDFEEIKSRLFIRVCNAKKNESLLKECPHKLIEDLAITCHVLIHEDEDGHTQFLVRNDMVETWNIDCEELIEIARNNTIDCRGRVFLSMGEIFGAEPTDDMFVISNRAGGDGAGTIFATGVMDSTARMLADNFYILPSSTEEVIIIREETVGELGGADVLEDMIKSAPVRYEDANWLSNEAYHYDFASKKFEKARTYEERIKEVA